MYSKSWSIGLLALISSAITITPAAAIDGEATYYYQNGKQGSCGVAHSDSDYIVALSGSAYHVSDFCGRTVTIKNTGGGQYNSGVGRVLTGTVADTCPECDAGHLDLSVGLWQGLHGADGMEHDGVFNIDWHFD